MVGLALHDRVGGDGERRKAVGPDLLQECRHWADDVVEGVEGVVVHPLDDLQTLPHAQPRSVSCHLETRTPVHPYTPESQTLT